MHLLHRLATSHVLLHTVEAAHQGLHHVLLTAALAAVAGRAS